MQCSLGAARQLVVQECHQIIGLKCCATGGTVPIFDRAKASKVRHHRLKQLSTLHHFSCQALRSCSHARWTSTHVGCEHRLRFSCLELVSIMRDSRRPGDTNLKSMTFSSCPYMCSNDHHWQLSTAPELATRTPYHMQDHLACRSIRAAAKRLCSLRLYKHAHHILRTVTLRGDVARCMLTKQLLLRHTSVIVSLFLWPLFWFQVRLINSP